MVEGPDVKLICQNDHCTVKIMFENECTLNALESYITILLMTDH